MKTSNLLAGLTTPFGNATSSQAGIVRLGTRNEILKAASAQVAVTPEPELMSKSFRNLAINGAFELWVRGTSITNKSSTYSLSFADCWKIACAGSWTYDVSRGQGGRNNNPNVGHNFNLKINNGDPTVDAGEYLMITQAIEKFNSSSLLNTPFSVSFNTFATKPGTAYFSLRTEYSTRSYVVPITIAANTWQRHKIELIPALLNNAYASFFPDTTVGLSCSICLACGNMYKTSVMNAWVDGNQISGPSQTNFVSSQNDVFKITDFQIEASPYATPFEARHISLERTLAERYIEGIGFSNRPICATSTIDAWDAVPYRVQKRAAPTVSYTLMNWSKQGIGWIFPSIYSFHTDFIDCLIISLGCNSGDVNKFVANYSYLYQFFGIVDCSL